VTRWWFILLAVALGWFTPAHAFAHTRASQAAYDARASLEKVVSVAGITMDTDEGDNRDPLSLHKYLFCKANSVDGTDPSGNDDLISFSVGESLDAGLDALEGVGDLGVEATEEETLAASEAMETEEAGAALDETAGQVEEDCELDTPTTARAVPKKNKRWDSFSPTNASQRRKARLLKLNRQTACPPRTAVPVNQGRHISSCTHNIQFAFGNDGDHPGYVRRKGNVSWFSWQSAINYAMPTV
jgi:hypothetical protein